MKRTSTFVAVIILLCTMHLAQAGMASPSVAILHSFGDDSVPSDGDVPNSLIRGSDGNLYLTTNFGGSTVGSGDNSLGYGTVTKITSAGGTTVLHSFRNGTVTNDGIYSNTPLVLGADGNFYGVTYQGGSTVAADPNHLGYGTVFKMTPAGVVTILHSFGDGSVTHDGISPSSLIQGTDGNFYGTTFEGGSTIATDPNGLGYGTVFKMSTAGHVTILHSFDDGSVANDGSHPLAGLLQSGAGSFYGTTYSGGGAANSGTVFKVTTASHLTILHSFSDGTITNDGAAPTAALTLGSDGDFYGTTSTGGFAASGEATAGNGTVFKITSAGAVTLLHLFQDGTVPHDGGTPGSSLTLGTDGNFYGTTQYGGTTTMTDPSGLGYGTAFQITPTGSVTLLHSFGDGTTFDDGQNPVTSLVEASSGVFYGTAAAGGAGSQGVFFQLTVNPGTPTLSARDTAAAPDGTARVLWARSDGAASLRTMSASDTQTTVGPTYGPFLGWSPKSVGVSDDGSSRILWTRSDGAAGLWTMSAGDMQTMVGTIYGPYTDSHGRWSATDVAVASDGTSRILWTRSDGAIGLWTMSAQNAQVRVGTVYGPISGWTAKRVGVSGDGTARMLWSRSDGAAGLWTMSASDTQTTVGPIYGPYTDSHGTWGAQDLGVSSDGTSQVLWTRSDGAAGLWSFSAADVQTTVGPVYGPYAGFTATALDSNSDQSRVLWVRSDRAAGLWSFGANDVERVIGSVYGPY